MNRDSCYVGNKRCNLFRDACIMILKINNWGPLHLQWKVHSEPERYIMKNTFLDCGLDTEEK